MKIKYRLLTFLIMSILASLGVSLLVTFLITRYFPEAIGSDVMGLSAMILRLTINYVLLLIITFAGIRKITGPLSTLTEATGRVARGDFDVTLRPYPYHDEVGQLIGHFNVMVEELRGNELMKKDFIQNVSHQFKTPLALLSGYLELLGDDALSPAERAHCVTMATDEIHRLNRMSSNILLLSKLDAESSLRSIATFSLTEQLRRVIVALEPPIRDGRLTLSVDLDECLYDGHADLLEQVWQNLLDNAITFTPPGGTIDVSLRQGPDEVVVTIKDSGIGIPADDKPRIFEQFYHGTDRHAGHSTGLGLSIVKRVVDLHGGAVTLESHEEEGTTFRVALPR